MILGIDSSTERLSLSLSGPDLPLRERAEAVPLRHGETILPALESLLAETGQSIRQLTGVAVGLGPGSFTGVRVGVATALGLAQSLGIPVSGISSFAAIAAAGGASRVLVMADARHDAWYTALYTRSGDRWAVEWPEGVLTVPAIAEQLPSGPVGLSGPAAAVVFSQVAALRPEIFLVPVENRWPQAAWVARLAEPELSQGGQNPESLQPLYVRRTQAEETRLQQQAKAAGHERG